MKTIILGAGITGLSAGVKTGFPVYEAKEVPGGICRSYYKNGYSFENGGGHWLFGGDLNSLNFIKQFGILEKYIRDSGIYFNNTIPYPIQTALNDDPCVLPGSMKHWLLERFGKELCNLFFFPFNEKYTANLYNFILSENEYKSPEPRKGGYNSTFHYPKEGLDTLVDNMAKQADVRYNKKAVRIDLSDKVVEFEDGEKFIFDRLISTLPLVKTQELCGVKDKMLPHTSTLVLNIGAEKGKNCPKEQWLYIPHSKSGFYRVGIYSNVSDRFAPKGKASLYVEKSYFESFESEEYLGYENRVIEELQDWGWIGAVDVVDPNWIEYAYTWLHRDSDVQGSIDWLKEYGIESIGRYGKWKFQGIMDSVSDGLGVEC